MSDARHGRWGPGDVAIVAVAAAAWVGAWLARPVAWPWALVVGFGACRSRWPVRRRLGLLGVAVLLAASAHASSSWRSLTMPVADHVSGRAVLVSDPRPVGAGTRVELAVAGRRYEATAYGATARTLAERQAGETVHVDGRAKAVDHRAMPWLVARHVAGRLALDDVSTPGPAAGPLKLANRLRRWLSEGISAGGLAGDDAALVAGITVGDDRHQSEAVTADFRIAGLTHLLAVSGQNVALVLGLALPLLRRRRPAVALVGALAVLGEFALVTRWEPSVLRAVTMSAIAAVATVSGRPASPMRLLALAVTGLVVIDPLLVHSVGFRLSVAATAAIVVAAPAIERRVPGPRPLAVALSVTAAAQLGVLPLQVLTFGVPSPVSIPANLAAGWAAGALMAWGVGAGLIAGLVPALAPALHLPSRMLARWLLIVARRAAAGATALASLAPAAHATTVDPVALGHGAQLWRAGSAIVVVAEPLDAEGLLSGLAAVGARHVDLVVLRHGGRRAQAWWDVVAPRLGGARVIGPAPPAGSPSADLPWTSARAAGRFELGGLVVVTSPAGAGLDVEVTVGSGGGT